MRGIATRLGWVLLGIGGALCLGRLALSRGESINAIWLLAAALATFVIAFRFYARFIANRVLVVDPTRVNV